MYHTDVLGISLAYLNDYHNSLTSAEFMSHGFSPAHKIILLSTIQWLIASEMTLHEARWLFFFPSFFYEFCRTMQGYRKDYWIRIWWNIILSDKVNTNILGLLFFIMLNVNCDNVNFWTTEKLILFFHFLQCSTPGMKNHHWK